MEYDKLDCRHLLVERLLEIIDKNNKIMNLYERWMQLKNRSQGVSQFICDNEFKKVAVYGMGSLGRSLCDELACNHIEISYVIDKNKNVNHTQYPFYTLQDELPETDVIIVTPITFFDEIEAELARKITCPILSLDDIIP